MKSGFLIRRPCSWVDFCSYGCLALMALLIVQVFVSHVGAVEGIRGLKQAYGCTLGRHWAMVNAVQYGPDGRWIASTGHDGNLFVWDSTTLESLASVRFSKSPTALAVHPAGKSIAVGFQRGQVRIYTFDNGALTESHRLTGLRGAVKHLHYTANGKQLIASASWTYFFDVTEPTPKETWILSSGAAMLDVSGEWLVLARQRQLDVWDISETKPRLVSEHSGKFVPMAMAAHAQDVWLGVFNEAETLLHWRWQDQQLTKRTAPVDLKRQIPRRIRISSDGQLAALDLNAGTSVTLWKMNENGQFQEWLDIPCFEVTDFAFSPDGQHLAVASNSGAVRCWKLGDTPAELPASINARRRVPSLRDRIWHTADGELLSICLKPQQGVGAANWMTRSRVVMNWTQDRELGEVDKPRMVKSVDQGEFFREVFPQGPRKISPSGYRQAVIFRPSNTRQSAPNSGSMGGYIQVSQIPRGEQNPNDGDAAVAQASSDIFIDGDFQAVAWAGESRILAATDDGELMVWDLEEKVRLFTRRLEGKPRALGYPRDGRVLVLQERFTRLMDYQLGFEVWDPRTDEASTQPLAFLDAPVQRIEVSGDGRTWVVVEATGWQNLYRFHSSGLEFLHRIFAPGLASCQLSVDGERLAVVRNYRRKHQVEFYDTSSGQLRNRWQLPGPIGGCSISTDNADLAVTNHNGSVYVFDVREPDQVAVGKLERFDPRPELFPSATNYQPPPDDVEGRAAFDRLNSEIDQALANWTKTKYSQLSINFLDCAKRYSALARRYAGTSVERDALVRLCQQEEYVSEESARSREFRRTLRKRAAETLLTKYLFDAAILPVVEPVCRAYPSQMFVARRLIREHTDRSVRARACLLLARSRVNFGLRRSADPRVKQLYQHVRAEFGDVVLFGDETVEEIVDRDMERWEIR